MADESPWAVRLIDRVSGSAKAMRGSVGRLETSLKSMVKTASGSGNIGKALGSGIQAGASKIKDGMLIAGLAVAGVAAGIGALTVKMVDFSQGARAGFQAVAKHGASAELLFKHARGEAERFGLDVMNTSNAFKGFLAQGADPAMATNLIRMGADLKAFGTDATQMESIFYNVKKIMSQGVAQGDELAPIWEAGINKLNVFERMAAKTGMTIEELKKKQTNGGLDSAIILPALIAESTQMTGGKNAGDAGLKATKTKLSVMLDVMKAQAQNLFLDIGDQAAPGIMGAFGAIRDELGGLLKDPAVKEGIIGAIDTMSKLIKDSIPFIKTFVGAFADGFLEAWPAIKGALGVLFEGFGSGATWMDTVREFAGLLGKIVGFAVGLGTVFGGMVAAGIQIASAEVQGAIYIWEGLINGIGAALFAVDNFFANLAAKWRAFDFIGLGSQLIDGLINGITAGVGWVVEAVQNLANSMLGAIKSTLGIASPSKEFAWMGEMSGEGFNEGLTNSLDTTGNRMGSMTGEAASDLGGAGGGSSNSIAIQIHVTSDGATGKQIGQDIGDELEPRLGSLFERWNLEAA